MAENEYIPEQESIIEDAFESVSKRAKENTKKEKSSEKTVKAKSQPKPEFSAFSSFWLAIKGRVTRVSAKS